MSDNLQPEQMKIAKIPEIIPIVPLFNMVVFPSMVFPLEVFGDQSIALIDEAMTSDRIIGLVLSRKAPDEINYQAEDFYQTGTGVVILRMAKAGDNKAQLLVQGISRFGIKEFIDDKPYPRARVETLEDHAVMDIEIEALVTNLIGLFEKMVKLSPVLPQEVGMMAKSISVPGTLADVVASVVNAGSEEKQKILEILDVKERLKEVTRLISHQVEILELGNKIQSQVKNDLDKSQREYYLRQQLKAIRQELGETDEEKVEIEEYRTKIEKKNLPPEAKKEAERELDRLSRMHPSSSEYTVSTTYLDWLTSLPWSESTEDNLDIKKAKKILDEDHFGLEKAKKRIIEYLAVRKLKPDSKGPILCFVGPPGTGKTSEPMWGRCPGGLFRESEERNSTIPCSFWMKSTSWAAIFMEIHLLRYLRFWTRSRIMLLRTTTWMCPLISPT
jgi:ATP-dependent Lon protease